TNQVNDFNNHASYNVPGYIGEFNDFYNDPVAWNFSVDAYNAAGLNWSMWSYKSTNALNPSNWGFFAPTFWATTPNVSTDSQSTIAADWQQWTTSNAFVQNTELGLSGNVNSAAVPTSSWFNVINQNSRACLDATNMGVTDGTAIQQWTCGNQQFNQEWQFQLQSDGAYSVGTRNAPTETWNVTNYGTTNQSPIQLWTYAGNTNEQWKPVFLGNGYYKFVGVGSGRCLDLPGASTANGVQLDIYDCNGTGAQAFSLSPQP
ncbi:MAG TPA: RICIN domain-containing protein, partial [Acidobacteriaceae bacterium]